MKKNIISISVFLLIFGNVYAQQPGTPTPLQQVINEMPVIPISLIGKNVKFEFGGDNWTAKVDGENFLAGDCVFEETGNGYNLTLKISYVWTGAVELVIDLFQKAAAPLRPSAASLRTAARSASGADNWTTLEGAVIILEYNEGPPVNISFVTIEKQEEDKQAKERRSRDTNILFNWGTWDKWLYLGGGMGVGGSIFTQGMAADLALLRFFSIELMPSMGLLFDGVHFVMPIMGKLGWRFEKTELSADIGYTPLFGLTVGGTFGINSGSDGAFFMKFITMPLSYPHEHSNIPIMYGFFGIKFGVGNRSR